MSTSDHVVDILVQEGGYRVLPRPFKIGSQSFDFTHALIAGERANDLVIVVELKGGTADDLVTRRLLALTRALDVLHSKRPVTVVLTTGQPSSGAVKSISRVCRVLTVGNPAGPHAVEAIRDWLAVLLPLMQPAAADVRLDWETDLRRVASATAGGALMEALIMAAPQGHESVERVLANCINGTVRPALERAEAMK
ncbi:MAG: hypothetical protein AB7E55_26230 [Pigmentiphaga sp.]